VRARATARGVRAVAKAIQKEGGKDAVSLRVAEQYVSAWGNIAKKGNTILLPADASNPANMIASAFAIYKNVLKQGGSSQDGKGSPDRKLDIGDDYYPKFDEDDDYTSSSETETDSQERSSKKEEPKETLSKETLPDQNKPLPP